MFNFVSVMIILIWPQMDLMCGRYQKQHDYSRDFFTIVETVQLLPTVIFQKVNVIDVCVAMIFLICSEI